ncbi:MAG: AI-2E family transporter [Alphaproteobacteria bacterium]
MNDRPDDPAPPESGWSRLKPLLVAGWLLIAVIIGSLLVFGREVLVPLAIAFLTWNFINALATLYQRWAQRVAPPLRRRAGRRLALVASAMTVVVVVLLVAQLVADSIAQLADNAPAFRQSLSEGLPSFLQGFGIDAPKFVDDMLASLNADDLLARTATALTTTAGNAGLIAVYVVFLLLEQQSFERKLDRLFDNPRHALQTRRILEQIEGRIETYLRIKTLVSLLTGAVTYVVLTAYSVDYAGFWAVWTFLLNYIPNIGSTVAVILPTLASLGQYNDWLLTTSLAVILGGLQATIGNFLEPRLMGPRVNLSPFVIILSLAVWGSVWGVAGLFLCVPLTMIVVIICAQIPATRPIAILLSADGRID